MKKNAPTQDQWARGRFCFTCYDVVVKLSVYSIEPDRYKYSVFHLINTIVLMYTIVKDDVNNAPLSLGVYPIKLVYVCNKECILYTIYTLHCKHT